MLETFSVFASHVVILAVFSSYASPTVFHPVTHVIFFRKTGSSCLDSFNRRTTLCAAQFPPRWFGLQENEDTAGERLPNKASRSTLQGADDPRPHNAGGTALPRGVQRTGKRGKGEREKGKEKVEKVENTWKNVEKSRKRETKGKKGEKKVKQGKKRENKGNTKEKKENEGKKGKN